MNKEQCTFKSGDVEPCPTCPRKITALHMCGLLNDELKLAVKDEERFKENHQLSKEDAQ